MMDGAIAGVGATEPDAIAEANQWGGSDAVMRATPALCDKIRAEGNSLDFAMTYFGATRDDAIAHLPTELSNLDHAHDDLQRGIIRLLADGHPQVAMTRAGGVRFFDHRGIWVGIGSSNWALYARDFLMGSDPVFARDAEEAAARASKKEAWITGQPLRDVQARVDAARRELSAAIAALNALEP